MRAVKEIKTPGRLRWSRGGRATALVVTLAMAATLVVAASLAVVTRRLSERSGSLSSTTSADYLAGADALAAEAAAARETQATLTYSYRTLSKDFATAEAGLTPRFRSSYESTTAASVTPAALKYHAVSRATVTDAGVSQAGADDATVLLFVDQIVTNTRLAHPRLDQSRIKVSMVKLDGRWLVDNLVPI